VVQLGVATVAQSNEVIRRLVEHTYIGQMVNLGGALPGAIRASSTSRFWHEARSSMAISSHFRISSNFSTSFMAQPRVWVAAEEQIAAQQYYRTTSAGELYFVRSKIPQYPPTSFIAARLLATARRAKFVARGNGSSPSRPARARNRISNRLMPIALLRSLIEDLRRDKEELRRGRKISYPLFKANRTQAP
jgi:hypothetical protein